LTIHAVDGFSSGIDKAEALGTAGVAVHHDLGGRDSAEFAKRLLQGVVTHAVGEVADVKLVSHGESSSISQNTKTMWSFNPA
jgi:hypothetical protein